MDLKNISGTNVQVHRIKDTATSKQIQEAIRVNGMSELVVQTDKGKFLISADNLDVQGQANLPNPGQEVDFGSVVGKVLFKDDEEQSGRIKIKSKLKSICEPTPAEAKQEEQNAIAAAKQEQENATTTSKKARLDAIAAALAHSETNTATANIYGDNPTLEDVQEWCQNNPLLLESPKLKRVCDYNRDGTLSPTELHKAIERKAVVLNGLDSFCLPSENKAPVTGPAQSAPSPERTPPSKPSAQESYYRRKNVEAAAEGAAAVGGALLKGINEVLR